MSGELVSAETAFAIGLVEKVVPRASLAASTADLLTAVLESSQATIRAAKSVTNMATRLLVAQDTETLTRFAVEVYDGKDLAEGVTAFLEHRRPEFTP
jgi:enoyl-CoA hydratase